MPLIDLTLFILYLLVCIGLAWHIRRQYQVFKIYKGFVILLISGVLASFIHNLISALWQQEEPVFFFIGSLVLGIGFFNFIFWLAVKIILRLKPKKKIE